MKFNAIYKISLEILPGCTIHSACKEAILIAQQLNYPVHFTFNDRIIRTVPGDGVDDLLDVWHKACQRTTQDSRIIETGRQIRAIKEKIGKVKKPKEEKPYRAPRRIVL
jgi:hypothetical protein